VCVCVYYSNVAGFSMCPPPLPPTAGGGILQEIPHGLTHTYTHMRTRTRIRTRIHIHTYTQTYTRTHTILILAAFIQYMQHPHTCNMTYILRTLYEIYNILYMTHIYIYTYILAAFIQYTQHPHTRNVTHIYCIRCMTYSICSV